LVAHEEWGIAAQGDAGLVHKVVWPYGYYAIDIEGRLALINESNRVAALVGDRIEAGGGFMPDDEAFTVCGMLDVVAR
jgi:hypothetical protein